MFVRLASRSCQLLFIIFTINITIIIIVIVMIITITAHISVILLVMQTIPKEIQHFGNIYSVSRPLREKERRPSTNDDWP